MHRYVHEAIYLYCKTHGPLVRGSELWVGPIWPHNKNIKFNNSLLYFTVLKDKLNALLLCL